MTNLTNMWRSVKARPSEKPYFWLRQEETKKFLKTLHKKLKVDSEATLKSVKGNGGGTYAHWQIATAYSKYLDPALHIEFNKYIKTYIVEEAYPEKGIVRNIENYRKKYKRLKNLLSPPVVFFHTVKRERISLNRQVTE